MKNNISIEKRDNVYYLLGCYAEQIEIITAIDDSIPIPKEDDGSFVIGFYEPEGLIIRIEDQVYVVEGGILIEADLNDFFKEEKQ